MIAKQRKAIALRTAPSGVTVIKENCCVQQSSDILCDSKQQHSQVNGSSEQNNMKNVFLETHETSSRTLHTSPGDNVKQLDQWSLEY